jgi:hypothetical protein
MAETLTKATKSQDAEKAQEKKRQLEPAPEHVNALANESIPFSGFLGVSAMEPAIEGHATFLGDPRFSHPANSTQKAGMVAELQGTYGNQYVRRLVQSMKVQAKLTVSSPDDQYEKGADRVADAVTRAPASSVQHQVSEEEEEEIQAKPIAEQITPLVQKQEEEEPIQTKLTNDIQVQRQAEEAEEEEEEPIQTKKAGGQTPLTSSSLQSRISSLKGGGQPLPKSTRRYFEPRFGADFSQVRVHTDSRAAETAESINAKAFTKGKDIVFGAGQYSPETSEGERLLAHELTHVVQQTSKHGLSKDNHVIDRRKFWRCGGRRISRPGIPIFPNQLHIQRQPNVDMYAAGELATDPDLKSVELKPVQLNELKEELLKFLNRKWQRTMGLNPETQNRPPYKHLLNGLVQGEVKIDKWAYLIAQSERENLGRRQPREQHQNEFNIIVRNWFKEIRNLGSVILNRKPVMNWMKKALEALKKAGGKIPTGFDPEKASANDWFELASEFKSIATPRTPGATGIATAAYLLLAYTSNQLCIAFQPGVIRKHNRNTIRQMDRTLSEALRRVKQSHTLVKKIQFPQSLLGRQRKIAPPEIRWHYDAEILLVRTKLSLQSGIKKLRQPQSDLPAVRSKLPSVEHWISTTIQHIDDLMSSTENFNPLSRRRMGQYYKHLKVAANKVSLAKKLKLAKERFAELTYVNRAALAFLASTGQANISGIQEARRFLSTGRTTWRAASQFKKFTKSIKEIRGEIKRLLALIRTRPGP